MARVAVKSHQSAVVTSNTATSSGTNSSGSASGEVNQSMTYILLSQLSVQLYNRLIPQQQVNISDSTYTCILKHYISIHWSAYYTFFYFLMPSAVTSCLRTSGSSYSCCAAMRACPDLTRVCATSLLLTWRSLTRARMRCTRRGGSSVRAYLTTVNSCLISMPIRYSAQLTLLLIFSRSSY